MYAARRYSEVQQQHAVHTYVYNVWFVGVTTLCRNTYKSSECLSVQPHLLTICKGVAKVLAECI